MPASSQTSPTSRTRVTGSSHVGAADPDAVDPRAAELRQVVERVDRALGELGLRPDHVQVPARARVERQRQPVVAAPGDVPVAEVAQPVVHALAHVLGHPLDLGVLREERRADLVGGDEPVVGEPIDDRRVAAPAVRVVVDGASPPRRGSRAPRGCRRSGRSPRRSRGRAASRSRRRSDRTRRSAPARAARASGRARSPRGRRRGRCGRCRSPPRARPRPTGRPGARSRRRATGCRTAPRT